MRRRVVAGWLRAAALVGVVVFATGCGDDKDSDTDKDAGAEVDTGPAKEPSREMVRSNRPRVRFKGGRRMATDLATALNLPRGELCKELGKFDCVDFVHNVALGGVEPYELGVREPLDQASVTTPIAVDRVALAACGQRAKLDFDTPESAFLFGDLAAATDATREAALKVTANRLYDQLLRRDANVDETAALVAFWDTAKAAAAKGADSATLARDYATLACFAVATSEEALFY